MAIKQTHKQAALYTETHKLLDELIESGYSTSNTAKTSKANIIHSLVVKLHKKEVKK